jgi:hypothetical protein
LFEQHLERTRTHPSATGRSNSTAETSNIWSSNVEARDIGSHSNITLEASDIGRSDIGSHSNIALETSDIGSSSIEASSTRTANGAAVGFLGAGFSGGSVIEHVFDLTGGV